MKKDKSKVIHKKFRPAIKELIAMYKKHPGKTVYYAKTSESSLDCPLCKAEDELREAVRDTDKNVVCCSLCPWMVMTDHLCHGHYMRLTTEKRIAQLEEWLNYVEK